MDDLVKLMRRQFLAMGVGLAAIFAALPVAAAPSFVVTRLGTLGGNGSYGNAINASGEVTGFSYLTQSTPTNPNPNAQWHAFVYSGGVMRDLGTLGGPFSSGTAVNDSSPLVRSRTSVRWAGPMDLRGASMRAAKSSVRRRLPGTRLTEVAHAVGQFFGIFKWVALPG